MNTKKRAMKMRNERGNALFLILIAVALFAALSYAITQSGRGGSGGVDRETVVITAGQVVEQPAAVRTAVTRMIITGTAASSITFTGAAAATDVFDSATGGGGATDLNPPAAACSPACTAWTYLPAASTTSGWYIDGVSTDSTDAMAFLPAVTSAVCSQILKGLGMATTPAVQHGADFDQTTAGAYAAGGGAATIGDNAGPLTGQAFACWDQDSGGGGSFAYFHALIEQ